MRFLCSLITTILFLSAESQNPTLEVNSSFESEIINPYTNIVSAKNLNEALEYRDTGKIESALNRTFFYFDFDNPYRFLFFDIENTEQDPKTVYLSFSNALIREVVLFEKVEGCCLKVYTTGIEYPFESRPELHRNFVFPLHLDSGMSHQYILQLKKETGRPLVTSITAYSSELFKKASAREYWIMGLYYGLCFIAVLFSLFVFIYIHDWLYLLYASYVLALSLHIGSYLGIFYQFLIPEGQGFHTYFNYVFFSELSLVLFILFSQKALKTNESTPKLKKIIEGLAILLVSLRLLLHFVFTSAFGNYVKVFMLFWYAFMLIATLIIMLQTVVYFRSNKSKGSLFVLALFFLETGALATILYHSFGVFDTYWAGFPILFYSSVLELVFLTFFVVYMVKDIYDERNKMSRVIADQQKSILKSYIKGENQERQRIGKELHDNIGSQLTRLKLALQPINKSEGLESSIDQICEEVRNLSHTIAPKEIKLVSFVLAIEELAADITKNLDINITISNYGFPEELRSPYREELYRVIQEALNNIIKHSKAKEVDIQLFKHTDELSISIEDYGTGFNYELKQNGFGLNSMKTRIKALAGDLTIDSRLNHGTLILINIPYPYQNT